jgi:hypothetical protein
MKALLISALLVSGLSGSLMAANYLPYDTSSKKFTYRKSFQTDIVNKEELASRTVKWMGFNYSNNFIQLTEETPGKIMADGVFTASLNKAIAGPENITSVYYSCVFEFKEGEVIVTISNLHYKYYRTDENGCSQWYENNFENQYNDLASQFKNVRAWLDFYLLCDDEVKAIEHSYQQFLENQPNLIRASAQ